MAAFYMFSSGDDWFGHPRFGPNASFAARAGRRCHRRGPPTHEEESEDGQGGWPHGGPPPQGPPPPPCQGPRGFHSHFHHHHHHGWAPPPPMAEEEDSHGRPPRRPSCGRPAPPQPGAPAPPPPGAPVPPPPGAPVPPPPHGYPSPPPPPPPHGFFFHPPPWGGPPPFGPPMHCHRPFARGEHGRRGRGHTSPLPRPEPSPAFYPGFGHVTLDRDESAARLIILLPGIPKEDMKIEVVQRTLQVEVPSKTEDRAPLFSRAFQLGDRLDIDGIDADLALGLLTITMPYKERRSAQPRRVVISADQEPASTSARVPADTPATAEAGALDGVAAEPAEPAAEPEADSPTARAGDWVSLSGADQAPASDDDGSVEDCPVDAVL